jgi:AcrR family transcriptional regulator
MVRQVAVAPDPQPLDPTVGYPKGRARRREILRIASEYFAENGYDAATIFAIAAACGISRAGLLRYFPDKEALLEGVLRYRDEEDRARFAPYASVPGGLGILRAMVDLAEHNEHSPGLISLFVRLSAEASSAEHPAHFYFSERLRRIRSGTERTLESAARAGYLRDGVDPAATAVQLTALMDGLQAQWLLDPALDMAGHMRRAILEILNTRGAAAFDAVETTG